MTVNSLEIHNFQSIKKAKLDFTAKPSGGSVTTIVGPSSTGKSAMLRALKMLLRNTSSAPVRIQEGAAKATVSADFNGIPVRIERGKSLSTYFIGTNKYSKAGTSVPQPVKDILKLDDSAVEIHTSTQFDRPYLIDESGTTVSSIIGKLTHANTLRLAVKEGNRRSLEAGRLLKTRLEDLEKTRENLTEYSWVDSSVRDVEDSKRLLSQYQELSTKDNVVSTCVSTAIERLQRYTEASQKALQSPDVSTEVSTASSLLERCVKVYSALTVIEDKKYFAAELLKKKPTTLDSTELEGAEEQLQKMKKVSALISAISAKLEEYQTLAKNLTQLKEASKDVQTVYSGTLQSAGYCPTCCQRVGAN